MSSGRMAVTPPLTGPIQIEGAGTAAVFPRDRERSAGLVGRTYPPYFGQPKPSNIPNWKPPSSRSAPATSASAAE